MGIGGPPAPIQTGPFNTADPGIAGMAGKKEKSIGPTQSLSPIYFTASAGIILLSYHSNKNFLNFVRTPNNLPNILA
jgi:hypothetical protein